MSFVAIMLSFLANNSVCCLSCKFAENAENA